MSKESLLIKGAHVVDPANGVDGICDILIENGMVARVESTIEATADQVIDATGLFAAPGLVDVHVHLRDPGLTYKEDVCTGCDAAAAGGVTSIACMPNTKPALNSPETIRYLIHKAKEHGKAKLYPIAYVRGDAGLLSNFEALRDAGAVAFSDDGLPVCDSREMYDSLLAAAALDMPVVAHCEDMLLSDGGIINESAVSTVLGVKGIKPAAEDVGTIKNLALCLNTDARLHVAHVSTRQSALYIKLFKELGACVTCETAPHYFCMDDSLLAKEDANFRMNPPLRSKEDMLGILNAIKDGTIDMIATDHAPHAAEEKEDFYNAPNGIVGLETSFAASITYLVKPGHITLPRLIELMSVTPASLLGIRAGSLAAGEPADIVLFDPDEIWTVDKAALHSKSHNTPFDGMQLTGKVKVTILDGAVVYREEE